MGGNGNQMFQYAAGLALARRHNTELLVDINYLIDKSKRHFRHENREYALEMFNITGKRASNEEIARFTVPRKGNKYFYHCKKRLYKDYHVFKERDLSSPDRFKELPSDAYIEGLWQLTQYFHDIKRELRTEFTFKRELPEQCAAVMKRIRNKTSICVHFRRGDYANHPILDVVKLDYYYAALKLILHRIDSAKLFIFSDDISWCSENFKPQEIEYEFVDQSLAGPTAEYHLHMISACNHYIIPNSTFAWWGAWLSESPGKIVIAPKNWWNGQLESINSIVPPEWITI
jgi:hypothetical protein